MIECEILFGDFDVVNPKVRFNIIPQIGSNIEFPIDFVKYTNGASLEDNVFKVVYIDNLIDEFGNCTKIQIGVA